MKILNYDEPQPKLGDKVKVVDSAYLSVKVGTTSTIIGYRFVDEGRDWTKYELDVPYQLAFYEWQLEIINEKE